MKKKITIISQYGDPIITYITPRISRHEATNGFNFLEFLSDDCLGRNIIISTKETILIEEIEKNI